MKNRQFPAVDDFISPVQRCELHPNRYGWEYGQKNTNSMFRKHIFINSKNSYF